MCNRHKRQFAPHGTDIVASTILIRLVFPNIFGCHIEIITLEGLGMKLQALHHIYKGIVQCHYNVDYSSGG